MKNFTKLLLVIFISGVSLFYLSMSVQAASLPSGIVIGDENGEKAKKDGFMQIAEDDLEPGQKFSHKITISNFEEKERPIPISLLLNGKDFPSDKKPVIKGKVDLSKAISVTLTLESQKNPVVLYKGAIDGTGEPNAREIPIEVGKVSPGGNPITIRADFEVVKVEKDDLAAMENWKRSSEAIVWWGFTVSDAVDPTTTSTSTTSTTTSDSTTTPSTSSSSPLRPKLPQTGDDWRNVLIGIIIGLLLIIVVLFIARKVKQKSE